MKYKLNIQRYLNRIRYNGSLEPDLTTLTSILQHHIAAIPFENIDVLLQKEIRLELENLEDKIIFNHRGGYCFEINTLFSALLQQLGFIVSHHSGRVYFGRENGEERPRTHMILVVHFEGEKYLVDATFGAHGLRVPVKLSSDTASLAEPHTPTDVASYSNGSLRLHKHYQKSDMMLLQAKINSHWNDLYVFDETEVEPIDYRVANFYTSQYPNSAFRNHLLAMITPIQKQGNRFSKILTLDKWTLSNEKTEEVSEVSNFQKFQSLLENEIGIELSEKDVKQLEFWYLEQKKN